MAPRRDRISVSPWRPLLERELEPVPHPVQLNAQADVGDDDDRHRQLPGAANGVGRAVDAVAPQRGEQAERHQTHGVVLAPQPENGNGVDQRDGQEEPPRQMHGLEQGGRHVRETDRHGVLVQLPVPRHSQEVLVVLPDLRAADVADATHEREQRQHQDEEDLGDVRHYLFERAHTRPFCGRLSDPVIYQFDQFVNTAIYCSYENFSARARC